MSLYIALMVLLVLFFILRLKSVFVFVVFLLLALILRSGVFIVNEGSQVVLTQFGRIIGTPYTNAGLYFKIPFFWKANYFDKRIFTTREMKTQIPTKDMYFIAVDVVTNWRIKHAVKYYENIGSVKEAESIINNLVSGSVRQTISNYALVDAVRAHENIETLSTINSLKKSSNQTNNAPTQRIGIYEPAMIGRAKLSQQMQQDIYKYGLDYGIEIMGIMITNIRYGKGVQQSIYERMILESLTKAETLRSTGRSNYQTMQGIIEKEYHNIVAPAQQKALLIKGKADAEATAIYAKEYSKNPGFFNFWRTLMAYEHAIPSKNQGTILTTDSSFFKLLSDRDAYETQNQP